MLPNFDEPIDRGPESGSYSSKWQGFGTSYPGYDVSGALPMWVADMDFPCPEEVTNAVVKRAQHGIFGYASGESVAAFKRAARGWYARRYGWDTPEEWMLFVPAVVPAINAAVQAFTEPGDGVIIQTPVYYPFMNSVRNNGRVIRNNPLILENGRYRMDLAGLERLAQEPKTKLLVLCSPHNPVGRVWTKKELSDLLAICRKWNVLVFSDEIHADLMIGDHRNTAIGTLAGPENRFIAACSPSKTFNIAGLQAGLVIIPDPALRARMEQQTVANRLPFSNIFGPIAGEAAYRYGDAYADALNAYLTENVAYATAFCESRIPGVRVMPMEGTYLAWLDFRGTGLPTEAINRLVLEQAKVAVDLGEWFGEGGEGFLRFNFACPRGTLEEALERLERAVQASHA